MAYEGLEQSPNIIYTGAAPNQQVIPAVSWCHEVLKARKFFLVGSDYVWPHCVNEIIKDQLKALGAECVGESYILFGRTEVDASVEAIKKAAPDVIISTVVGDSNAPFYLGLKAAGILPQRTPVLSFSIAEDELRKLPVRDMVGNYAAWDYFQSIDRPENREFIRQVPGEIRRRPRHQRCDRGGVQQRTPVGTGRRRGRVRRRRRRDQGHPPTEPQCAGGDRVGGRRDPAHLAARLRRPDPGRRPIRPGLELGEAGATDPVSILAVARGMGFVP